MPKREDLEKILSKAETIRYLELMSKGERMTESEVMETLTLGIKANSLSVQALQYAKEIADSLDEARGAISEERQYDLMTLCSGFGAFLEKAKTMLELSRYIKYFIETAYCLGRRDGLLGTFAVRPEGVDEKKIA